MNEDRYRLLAADEAASVTVYNESSQSPFLIVADHAGNLMPRSINGLGLTERDRSTHIALDIGIAEVS